MIQPPLKKENLNYCEPRPKGRGITWKGLCTLPNSDLNYPALKGQVFFKLDTTH